MRRDKNKEAVENKNNIKEEVTDEIVDKDNVSEDNSAETNEEVNNAEVSNSDNNANGNDEQIIDVETLVKEYNMLKDAYDEANDKYLRLAAEYDNFRKRTAKEREGIYNDAYGDVLKEILPIMDNLERAAMYPGGDEVVKGVELTLNQFKEVIKKLGIEEIEAKVGGEFDPLYHNALMHCEDENYGENTIAEVFAKGYKRGDRVLRFSLVKVAN